MPDSVTLRVLRGSSDASIRFADLRKFLLKLGFAERIKGGRHIFAHAGIAEILNLQAKNPIAKPYQVKQLRKVLVQYKLAEGTQ